MSVVTVRQVVHTEKLGFQLKTTKYEISVTTPFVSKLILIREKEK